MGKWAERYVQRAEARAAEPDARYPLTPGQHVLHLLLTVLTCGLWLPVWIIRAMAGNRPYVAPGRAARRRRGSRRAGGIARRADGGAGVRRRVRVVGEGAPGDPRARTAVRGLQASWSGRPVMTDGAGLGGDAAAAEAGAAASLVHWLPCGPALGGRLPFRSRSPFSADNPGRSSGAMIRAVAASTGLESRRPAWNAGDLHRRSYCSAGVSGRAGADFAGGCGRAVMRLSPALRSSMLNVVSPLPDLRWTAECPARR